MIMMRPTLRARAGMSILLLACGVAALCAAVPDMTRDETSSTQSGSGFSRVAEPGRRLLRGGRALLQDGAPLAASPPPPATTAPANATQADGVSLPGQVCRGTHCTAILTALIVLLAVMLAGITWGFIVCYRANHRQLQLLQAAAAGHPLAVGPGSSRRHRKEAATLAAAEMVEVLLPVPQESVGATLECPVCFEEATCDADRWRVLPCQHGICAKCLDSIVQSHGFKTCCPLCREQVLKNSQREEESADPAPVRAIVLQPAAIFNSPFWYSPEAILNGGRLPAPVRRSTPPVSQTGSPVGPSETEMVEGSAGPRPSQNAVP